MTTTNLSFPLSSPDVRALVRASVPSVRPTRPHCRAGACVLAIGAFDGLHLGHRELIGACIDDARRRCASAVVVTFDPDPSELLASKQAERRLLAIADRVSLCYALGADDVVVIPFDESLSRLSPEAFIDHLGTLVPTIASVHVGSNFRFGHKGAGTVETLADLGRSRGFDVVAHGLLRAGGSTVSSTRIRALLARGDVARAAALLSRHHFVRGAVEHGRGEGSSFGFPTANVRCDALSCLPGEGVYACVVSDGSSAWPAAVNVGMPPTFTTDRNAAFLEANLLGFEGDLYGRELAVVFVEWLRASRPFSSIDELERVVLSNIAWVRENIGGERVEVSL